MCRKETLGLVDGVFAEVKNARSQNGIRNIYKFVMRAPASDRDVTLNIAHN